MTSAFDGDGRFGAERFGGCYAPEVLVMPLRQLAATCSQAFADPVFIQRLEHELQTFVGRPTPLTDAPRLAAATGLGRVFLKREDLCHTGAHKINNAVAQVLLAQRMGKQEIIAETGAGQHGVATAAACARLGARCTIYMGATDMTRQRPNVERMRLLGAEVVAVHTGQGTLKEAVNAALRAWAARCDDAHYVLGSVLGPHPFPVLVRTAQSVIGREARLQVLQQSGALPDAIVACAGGGSNSLGLFSAFLSDDVRLIAVEAGGHGRGLGEHAARFSGGQVGVLHGCRTMLLQDEHGRTAETASVSAGLDYPAIGPELAALIHEGRVDVWRVDDASALSAARTLCVTEGIIPALESAHALASLGAIGSSGFRTVLVGLSGRGDKDMATYSEGGVS